MRFSARQQKLSPQAIYFPKLRTHMHLQVRTGRPEEDNKRQISNTLQCPTKNQVTISILP
jgi:hypothetical protein